MGSPNCNKRFFPEASMIFVSIACWCILRSEFFNYQSMFRKLAKLYIQKSYRRNGWLRTTIFSRNGCRMPTLRNGFVPQPFFIDNRFFSKPFFLETLSQRCENRSSSPKKIWLILPALFLLCLFQTNLPAAVSISKLESSILVVKLKHYKIIETPIFFLRTF